MCEIQIKASIHENHFLSVIIKMGKRIATTKGEIYDGKQELITTLMHTSYLIKKHII